MHTQERNDTKRSYNGTRIFVVLESPGFLRRELYGNKIACGILITGIVSAIIQTAFGNEVVLKVETGNNALHKISRKYGEIKL